MRGLFYYRIHKDDAQNKGIVQKCMDITEAVQGYGAQIELVFFNDHGLISSSGKTFPFHFSTKKRSLGHALAYYTWADGVVLDMCKSESFDFLYIRHMPTHGRFVAALKALKTAQPTLNIILEFPTWPYDQEFSGWKGKLLLAVDQFYRKKLRQYVDLAVAVGTHAQVLGMQTLRIENGMSARAIQPRTLLNALEPSPFRDRLNLVFVGNTAPWHGLDRLLHGMAAQSLDKTPTVHLTLVGEGYESSELKKLVAALHLTERVEFLPACYGENLHNICANMHVAIGSLGIHRIGISEAAPLKHRNYCGMGLPFVYGCYDPDFADCRFALRVAADESPLFIQDIVDFYHNMSANQGNIAEEVCQFARQELTWETKLLGLRNWIWQQEDL